MISRAILILNIFFFLTVIGQSQPRYDDDAPRRVMKRRLSDLDDRTVVVEKIVGLRVSDYDDDDRTVVIEKIVGSKLPDCSHACGSCSPCKLVTVRLVPCNIPTEAEPCPLAYRCMCQNKLFPVPK